MNYRNFSRAAAICILLLLCTILWPAAPLHAASEPSAILTAEEKAFVEGLDELTIGCLCNCDPVLYCNRDGEVRGITHDILELVAKYTGLRFRYSPLPSGQITYDTLCEMQLDLMASVEHNTVNARTSGVLLSEPYLQAAKVIVCRDDTKFNPSGSMSVGVVSGSLTIEKAIHEIYPEFDVFFFDDVEKALAAVNDGTVDGLIQNQYSIDVLMRKPLYENLHVVAAAGIGDLHCLSPVLSETASPDSEEFEEKKLLISIINKGIASLSDAEVTMILLDQTSRRAYKPGIGDFIYQYRYMLAVVLFVAAQNFCQIFSEFLTKKYSRKDWHYPIFSAILFLMRSGGKPALLVILLLCLLIQQGFYFFLCLFKVFTPIKDFKDLPCLVFLSQRPKHFT